MRRRVILAGVLAALPAAAIGADKVKEKTLKERLQGRWVRPNDVLSFSINGDAMVEFHEAKPFAPFNQGGIEFEENREKAIVRMKTGHTLWLFSAGPDVVAVETFTPDGKLFDNGRVFYRQGTYSP